MTIEKEGIYDISEYDYHSDPCPTPSLSSGMAVDLLTKSPLHVFTKSTRLNKNAIREDKRVYDAGTIAHALLLGQNVGLKVLDFKDFRTKEAKEARENVVKSDKIALLTHEYAEIQSMVNTTRSALTDSGNIKLVSDGKPEQSMFWFEEEFGIWCRARVDYIPNELPYLVDYKTTASSARPDEWARRQLFAYHKYIQAVLYMRGYKKITGQHRDFVFLVQENTPPYAQSVICLDGHALEMANEKLEMTMRKFAQCLKDDTWHGYSHKLYVAQAPTYMLMDWDMNKHREELDNE